MPYMLLPLLGFNDGPSGLQAAKYLFEDQVQSEVGHVLQLPRHVAIGSRPRGRAASICGSALHWHGGVLGEKDKPI